MNRLISLLEKEIEIIDQRIEQRNGPCYFDEDNKKIHLDGEAKGLEKAIKIVKQLNGGWIPIKERLPTKEEYLKNDGKFIVTDGQKVYQSLYDIYDLKTFCEVYYDRTTHILYTTIDKRPIAWQILPETFMEVEIES